MLTNCYGVYKCPFQVYPRAKWDTAVNTSVLEAACPITASVALALS